MAYGYDGDMRGVIMTESAGDSSEQQNAEKWLLDELSEKRGFKLIKKRFDLEGARQI